MKFSLFPSIAYHVTHAIRHHNYTGFDEISLPRFDFSLIMLVNYRHILFSYIVARAFIPLIICFIFIITSLLAL